MISLAAAAAALKFPELPLVHGRHSGRQLFSCTRRREEECFVEFFMLKRMSGVCLCKGAL